MEENELKHYGVLGMKWGVRKDRKRGKKKKVKVTLESPFKRKQEAAQKEPSKKRSISDMSDDELRAFINRIQLEKQYAQLIAKPPSKGKAFVKRFIAENAQSIAKSAIQKTANRAIDSMLDKKFGKSSDKKKDDSNKSKDKNN